jgi:hypothetical protein
MGKARLPDLPDTGRRYVENTQRARLASPGLERFPRAQREGWSGARVALAALGLLALAAAVVWLAR